ncbi:hypothetical protein I79_010416 [Cricetulus griseus]|uniref:Uncharacterized protein n=1 Tax=Cricetulus griseus TaxID=10029 RepID=G3HIF5_CRIGR|nr:hypothetical protein I79_010416 [Cricetulus griseus]
MISLLPPGASWSQLLWRQLGIFVPSHVISRVTYIAPNGVSSCKVFSFKPSCVWKDCCHQLILPGRSLNPPKCCCLEFPIAFSHRTLKMFRKWRCETDTKQQHFYELLRVVTPRPEPLDSFEETWILRTTELATQLLI